MTPEQRIALNYVLGYIATSEVCKPYKWVLHDMLDEAPRTVSLHEAIAHTTTADLDKMANYNTGTMYRDAVEGDIPLYAAPIPATVLSDERIRRIWLIETGTTEQDSPLAIIDFARAILAANGEKK